MLVGNFFKDIKQEYKIGIKPILMKKSPNLFKNPHTVPKLKKIQVNRGLGVTAQNNNILKKNIEEFEKITGQKPVITRAKKAIATFKLREGMPIGVKVTLRKSHMYEFIDRLINVALPRVRDFRGLNGKSFDGNGNYSLGLKEQIVFPEIDYDNIDTIRGMDICVVTSAKSDEEGKELLKNFDFPFIN